MSRFWRVLLEEEFFSRWSDSFFLNDLTKVSSFILKDNTLPCDSSYYQQIPRNAAGVSFLWTLCKKVYVLIENRLCSIKIIFWRKLSAVSDNNHFGYSYRQTIEKNFEYLF